eukprot:3984997-Prymnesium_polylepis.1
MAARHMQKMPRRLTRRTASKLAGSTSGVFRFTLPVIPAVCTSTSRRPHRLTTARTVSAAAPTSVMSAACAKASTPGHLERSVSSAFSSAGWLRLRVTGGG